MATRKQSEPTRTAPSIAPQKGIELLRKQIETGRNLLESQPLDRALLDGWYNTTAHIVDKAFGENSPTRVTFAQSRGPTIAVWGASPQEQEAQRVSTLEHRITLLGTFIRHLEIESEMTQEHPAQPREFIEKTQSREVFIVHGHQHGAKEEVARFVEKLGFKAVILHEQPNLGRTLFEKLKDHAEVAYAVILLTGDDRGGPNVDGVTLQ